MIWINKTYPPVRDQSQTLHLFFAGIFLFVGAQNHPLMMVGIKSFLSQPLKLHFRPPVQIYGISSRLLQKMLSNNTEMTILIYNIYKIQHNFHTTLTLLDQIFEISIFSWWIKGNGIHAELSTIVSCLFPLKLSVQAVFEPWKMIFFAKPLHMNFS